MSKNNKKLIRYTSRDFNSIKESLVEYARRYYPDTHKDFSEASFGSLMLDTVAYVGDVLSFYLDYQTNESFLDTSIEYNNVVRLGEQAGYRQSLKTNSFGTATLYILAPSDPNGSAPDTKYLSVLAKGTKFTTNAGKIFELVDNVDFANPDNEVVVGTTTPSDGSQTSFAVKAYGVVMSGQLKEESVKVGDFKRFLTIPLSDPNISEIVSVIDTEGHEYFEVDYLSQDTIFRSVINKDPGTRTRVPSIVVATSVPRRFITFNRTGQIILKFGYGSESSLKKDNVTHPSNVVLQLHGRDYETDNSFDPSKLLETDKFGIVPANTTLKIVYRANTTEDANTSTKTLTNISDPIYIFKETAVNQSKINFVKNSIEVTNEEPITGDLSLPSIGELKQRINDVFSTQNRAVTAQDYEALIYRMPAKFGSVKRVKLVRDHDSFKRNLNLYVLSENPDGNLESCHQVLKNNIKTWINNYKMINDTIDILDAKVINIGIKFVAVTNYDQEKFEALNAAITAIQGMFTTKLDIAQPIYITKIYDILNELEEIVDVTDAQIIHKSGGLYSDYSFNINHYISADGRILYAPENIVYELKYPHIDIVGTIK
tara:strand:+ start:423 stop:2219 length:1797 start_codon:yes stop_codon:yes gene_type:complete